MALILGMLVSFINQVGRVHPSFVRISECVCAFFVAFTTRLIHAFITPLCFKAVAFGSIIFLFKGVMIALSIVELVTKNYVTGSSKLLYGILISALIGFGLDVGTTTYASIMGISAQDALNQTVCGADHGVTAYVYPLLFLGSSTCFNLMINAHVT